ncbi:hypothetical protein BSL78_26293 [Apostichopus japonicus]|uniref:Uncharacterized protein n=1 Tax=Stichopus japonicus TaxID=307972 RepID=A0A2G8JMB7_STIJA|nr:hypothetical protein BSL78_26293 [Apostichopus japonicus]
MKAVKEAKCVKRVVLTSAGLAIIGFMKGGEFSEKDWPENEDELDAYAKSKTKAEKEAWEFVKNLEDGEKFELAVINPTAVLGPVLHSQMGTSMEIIKRILTRNPPLIPKLNIPAVDVRDVAKAHVVAMTEPEAAGNRHILSTDNIWWSEMAAYVAEEFKPQGYKIASVACPKVAIQVTALFDKDVKSILPHWNTITKLDNTRMKEVLKIDEPIDLKTTVIDMAYSMIEGGFVKKTSKYRGRNWKEIFEQEKAEKEKARAEKDQVKAEKIAAKRASKRAKVTVSKENGDADVVKENGEAEGEKKDETKDEEEGKEEAKEKNEGEETKEETGEKKEDAEEKKEEVVEVKKEETEEEKKEEADEKKEDAKNEEKEKDETEETKEEKPDVAVSESKEEETPAAEEEKAPAEEAQTPVEEEDKKPAEEATPATVEEEAVPKEEPAAEAPGSPEEEKEKESEAGKEDEAAA